MKRLLLILAILTTIVFAENRFKERVNMGGHRLTGVGKGVNLTDAVNVEQLSGIVSNINNFIDVNGLDTQFSYDEAGNYIYPTKGEAVLVKIPTLQTYGSIQLGDRAVLDVIDNDDVLNVSGIGRFYARDIMCSNLLVLDTGAWYFTPPTIFSNVVDIINSDTGLYSAVNYGFLTNYVESFNFTTLGYATTNYVDSGISSMGQSVVDTMGEYVDDRIANTELLLTQFSESNKYEAIDISTNSANDYTDNATNSVLLTADNNLFNTSTNILSESGNYTDDRADTTLLSAMTYTDAKHDTEMILEEGVKIYWMATDGSWTNWMTMNQTQMIMRINNNYKITE